MKNTFLGIDISKDKFDICLLVGDSKLIGKFDNNKSGFHKLLNWLQKKKIDLISIQACMEATGKYGEDLAYFLSSKNIKTSIVNPASVHYFGESSITRNKTDKIDAELICKFCEINKPDTWNPPTEEEREVKEVTRLIESLEAERQRHKNRLESRLVSETAIEATKNSIKSLNEQIKFLEKRKNELAKKDKEISKKIELLESIPGIATKTAIKFTSEIPNIERYENAKSLAAMFGITPSQRQSGSSVNSTKISKKGNRRLRKAFYMPAISAMQHNKFVREFVEKLREKGKKGKEVICAAMRKLIHIIYGVLKSGKPFDPNYQNPTLST
jgi:transposase